MKMLITLLIAGSAGTLLIAVGPKIQQSNLVLHPIPFVNGMAKYQIFALCVALIALLATLLLNAESKELLQIGQLSIAATKEKWLGINGRSSWLSNGLQLLVFISLATAIFMFLGVKHTNSLSNFRWSFVPIVLLFSLSNSLAEEIIFRFTIVGGLSGHYPKLTILLMSAILFGLPHYFGFPSGIIGVIMSGLLGYILCKATIETQGLSIAWGIHFVQDVIIFMALMMMNVKTG